MNVDNQGLLINRKTRRTLIKCTLKKNEQTLSALKRLKTFFAPNT